MRDPIMLLKEYNASKVILSRSFLTLKDGGKLLSVAYGSQREPFVLQTPPLYVQTVSPYYVDAIFDATNAKGLAFLDAVLSIDNMLLQTATDRSREWIGRPEPRCALADVMRRSIVTLDPATVRLKSMVDLEPRSIVRCLIEVPYMWFNMDAFGVTLKIVKSETLQQPSQ